MSAATATATSATITGALWLRGAAPARSSAALTIVVGQAGWTVFDTTNLWL